MREKKTKPKFLSISLLFLLIVLTLITCGEDPTSPQGKQYPDNSIPIMVDETVEVYGFYFQRWSPDGNKIALWGRDLTDENYDVCLFTIDSDGSNPFVLFNLDEYFNYEGNGAGISWSPDGQYISFCVNNTEPESDKRLYYISENGDNLTEIELPDNIEPFFCDWSPDGEWILIDATDTNIEWSNFYKLRVDGSELTQLTFDNNDYKLHYDPRWSPDGEWIGCIYQYDYDAKTEIVKMPSDGGEHIILTDTPGLWVKNPCWSPDGEWVAYSEEVYSVWNDDWEPNDIWVVKADGSFESYQITNSYPDDTDNVLEFFGDMSQDWDENNGILFNSLSDRHGENTTIWRIEPKDGVDFQ